MAPNDRSRFLERCRERPSRWATGRCLQEFPMTFQIPSAVQWAIAFLEAHVIYWVVCGALVFEVRYLLHKNRREQIAMSRLGQASRNDQPAFFWFLWGLHIVATSFFSLLLLGYFSRLL